VACDGAGVAGMNGVMAPSSGGALTAGYPVQPNSHLTTHQLPEHTSNIAPQFAGKLSTSRSCYSDLMVTF